MEGEGTDYWMTCHKWDSIAIENPCRKLRIKLLFAILRLGLSIHNPIQFPYQTKNHRTILSDKRSITHTSFIT